MLACFLVLHFLPVEFDSFQIRGKNSDSELHCICLHHVAHVVDGGFQTK